MSLKSLRGRSTVIGPAKIFDAPNPLNAGNYTGAWAFSDGRMAFSDGTTWQELISNITQVVTKTVGSGGDFPTIGAALSYFSGFSPSAAVYEFLGRIIILNTYTAAEQIQMVSQEMGWVTIESQVLTTASVSRTGNVSTVTFTTPHGLAIGRTFGLSGCTDSSFDILTGTVTGVPSETSITYAQTASNVANTADTTGTCHVDIDVDLRAFELDDLFISVLRCFMSFANGTAPIIRCRFKAINTAPINTDTGVPYITAGMALRACFFATLDDTPLPADPPAVTYVFRSSIAGFDENIRIGANSTARITCMEFKNGINNIISSVGTLTLLRSRVRGGSFANIQAQAGSRVTIAFTDFQRTQGSNSDSDLLVIQGSIASIIGQTSIGGISESEIVPTDNGIVFDSRENLIPTWAGFIKPQEFTVLTLPLASDYPGSMVYVTNEVGGVTIAFSDGTNWRRAQDRNIVSNVT